MLKSLINEIKTLAQSHAQINSVYYGDIEDWFTLARGTEKDVKYPAFFFVFTNVRIGNKEKTLSLNMWSVDRLLPEYENITDVHNDQLFIVEDIVGELRDESRDWVADDDFTAEPFTDNGIVAVDNAGGISATVSLKGIHAFDCNTFPTKPDDRIFDTPFNEVFS